ncbi:hypothetical protein [Mycolicibacterium sediminis]|uniref:Lipoprotein n=1 Tax=Mycolicibacterium sediminis TaxID=1286180 RepID=A0A7I7QN53_9MYCO|nr:hypothetical protein [Mycolicibacterium sediminis]BBY27734.1 hypothetical protein MSEDJ_18300 [Mycolicibacterium sediminis]
MRRALVALLAIVVLTACSGSPEDSGPYGVESATLGESQATLGWNLSVANLRFEGDYVLVDVDAAPTDPAAPRAKPESIRLGLYGALAHPIEANAIGGCSDVTDLNVTPATATPDSLRGTVCLGPLRDQTQVRGVYAYSPQDRIAGTTVAYPASFPVGLTPTNDSDTGLILQTSTVDAFRADGGKLNPTALGDPTAFQGNGYMLLGLEITGLAARYRDDSARRGGPLMVTVAPTLPGKGLSYACSVYGSSLLVLPEASLEAIAVKASLCTQGEINAALLYPTVSVMGTHAALWTTPSV